MPLDSESTSLFIDVEGRFDHNGAARILLNGRPLSITASRALRNYSDGFDWGYLGRGPAQTAIAICQALWPNKPLYALVLYPIFKRRFVAQWPHRIPFFYTLDLTTFLLEEADCLQAVEAAGAGLEWLLREGPLADPLPDPAWPATGADAGTFGAGEGASATGLTRSVRTGRPARGPAASDTKLVGSGLLPATDEGETLRFQPGDVVTIQGTDRHGERAFVYGCYDRQPVAGGPIGQGVLLISESGVDLGGWGEQGEGHLVLAYHSRLQYAYTTPQQLRVDGRAGRFREVFTSQTPVAGSPTIEPATGVTAVCR